MTRWWTRPFSGERALGRWCLWPGLAVLLLLTLVPGLVMAWYSLLGRSPIGDPVGPPSLENYLRFAGFTGEGEWNSVYLRILLRSLLLGLVVTAGCILIGYPYAFFIARSRFRAVLLALTIIPFWTNFLIRIYAWVVLLQRKGPLNALLTAVGLDPVQLYPSYTGIVIVTIYTALPFLVMPVYAAVERIDWSLAEAAQDLGAGRIRTFIHAVLPQTLPGLAAGALLVFVPATGVYVISDIMGGGKQMFIGNLVAQQFSTARDWGFGAAAGIILTAVTLLALLVLTRRNRRPADMVA
jgi:spermidine/putrescine transport system permease protein